ncbi:MAG: GxxExxY protein [bacterium]|nr:GxxExxY protein [bacterium]
MMRNDIIYPDLSYKITGLLMQTQKELGRFCKEKQYADLFEIFLKKEGISYGREVVGNFNIEGNLIKGNRFDFVVEDKILVELKSVPFITKRDYYQTMRYLKAANLRLGLLVNLRSEYLKPKRILNSSHH